jgi:epoxyqueuosine reductase
MDLGHRLKTLAETLGADYFGIADLEPAQDFIRSQGGERVSRYSRAVVMGIALLDNLVDLLPEAEDKAAAILYRHHSYDVVNQSLDQMALQAANTIQRAGYAAFPVPASRRTDDDHICGIFSHKLAAHLAGCGWIGKNCLLITPEHGPRVRWITVLTDAPLTPTGKPMAERCGTCSMCVKVCPLHAFTGKPFCEPEPREARFDAAACDRYFRGLEKTRGVAVCGMCLYICPYGGKRLKEQSTDHDEN